MFGSLGIPEITFILVLALLVFGPRKLPEIGRTLGRGLGEFRRATNDLRRSIETEIAAEEVPSRPAPVPAPQEASAAESAIAPVVAQTATPTTPATSVPIAPAAPVPVVAADAPVAAEAPGVTGPGAAEEPPEAGDADDDGRTGA